MNRALLEKIIFEETKNLSQETLSEILDFIRFKKLKKIMGNKSIEQQIKQELTSLNEISLIHLEEEFRNYKERFPYEG